MAKPPVKVSISVAIAGDTKGDIMAAQVFGALDRHGLAPQTVSTIAENPVPVTVAEDFTERWLIQSESRRFETNAPVTFHHGANWRRKTAPQGWGSVSHRLVNVKGRVKLGRINMLHTFSPRVDWKAAFVDLCSAVTPITATLNVVRPTSRSDLGFVDAYPLPARPKRERITKPVQADDTPWGTLSDVPWGLWLGALWEDRRRAELEAHMIASGQMLHLTDTVPRDPGILAEGRAKIRAAAPDLFDTPLHTQGLP